MRRHKLPATTKRMITVVVPKDAQVLHNVVLTAEVSVPFRPMDIGKCGIIPTMPMTGIKMTAANNRAAIQAPVSHFLSTVTLSSVFFYPATE